MLTGIIDSGQKIITDGLVLHLDAAQLRSYTGSGTTWTDLSGGNNNGSLVNGPTFNSANGGSIVFDGINDYGTIADINGVTEFTSSDNYTIDFWCFLNATQNDTRFGDNDIIEKWSGTGGYPYVFRYLRLTQMMGVQVYDGTNVAYCEIQISHSNWWHICGTFNHATDILNVYGNGNSVTNSTTMNLSGNITNTSPLQLMRRGNNQNYVTGRLANLKIYNRALSATEVLQNYNAIKSRFGL